MFDLLKLFGAHNPELIAIEAENEMLRVEAMLMHAFVAGAEWGADPDSEDELVAAFIRWRRAFREKMADQSGD